MSERALPRPNVSKHWWPAPGIPGAWLGPISEPIGLFWVFRDGRMLQQWPPPASLDEVLVEFDRVQRAGPIEGLVIGLEARARKAIRWVAKDLDSWPSCVWWMATRGDPRLRASIQRFMDDDWLRAGC